MDLTSLIVSFAAGGIWAIVKIMILVILALYVLFGMVIVRQIILMRSAVEIAPTSLLEIIAVVHLFASIAILILAVILL